VICWRECELRTAQLAGFASENRLQSCADCRVLENAWNQPRRAQRPHPAGYGRGLSWLEHGLLPVSGVSWLYS
jgi:hypothetical protein